jgi:hypothetical protein
LVRQIACDLELDRDGAPGTRILVYVSSSFVILAAAYSIQPYFVYVNIYYSTLQELLADDINPGASRRRKGRF